MPRLRTSILFLITFLLVAVMARSQAIYKTPYGKKYYLGTCRMVKNVSEKITLEKAKDLGLGPCTFCRPAVEKKSLYTKEENKAQGAGKTVQCSGITRAGTRCKHRTSIANGYCFQHQP